MARKILKLYYISPTTGLYTILGDLNDGVTYEGRTVGLFSTPESEFELADAAYNIPYLNRVKTKERAFSVLVSIKAEPFTNAFNAVVAPLLKVCFLEDSNGKQQPIRWVVTRNGFSNQYIDAYVEQVRPASDTDPTLYEIVCTAVDPYLTTGYNIVEDPEPLEVDGVTGSDPGMDSDFTINYAATAVSEPSISITIGGHGGVYRYYRDIVVVNEADYPLIYYPICITLGDISALIGTKFHEFSGVDHRIRDIRVETLGGARKVCFVRDQGNAHTNVKVWTILYSLQPGESKTLRVLYGNPNAPTNEVEVNGTGDLSNNAVRPMFNMYDSDNTMWEYVDFMPGPTTPQTRAAQWNAFVPGSTNITWIGYQHPHFDIGTTGNVNCAGAKALYLAAASGFAGMQLHTPVPPSSISYTARVASNFKAPLVLRTQRPDGRFADDYNTSSYNFTWMSYLEFDIGAGLTSCTVVSTTRAGCSVAVGDTMYIERDDGSSFRCTVTAVNPATQLINFTPAYTGVSASTNNRVQHEKVLTLGGSWALGDQPARIIFGMRSDSTLNIGDWYYGAVDFCQITWESSKRPAVTTWASAGEVDLTVTGFQVKGRFGNATINEFIGINTILPAIGDKLVVDCKARTCYYYHWNGTSFDTPVSRMEAMRFDAVRRYWVHVKPLGGTQVIRFLADDQSLLINLTVNITVPIRYLA